MLKGEALLNYIEETKELSRLLGDRCYYFDQGERIPFAEAARTANAFRQALERVRAEEREACARVCDEAVWDGRNQAVAETVSYALAKTIRARKEKE